MAYPNDGRRDVRLTKGLLHIETPLGIVNVRVGLSDRTGREVVSIESIPDECAGQPRVRRYGAANVRLVALKQTVRGG